MLSPQIYHFFPQNIKDICVCHFFLLPLRGKGSPAPEWRFDGAGIWTIFYNKISPNTEEKSSEKSSQKILVLIESDPIISAKEIAEKLGITSRSVEKHIKNLRDKGILRRVGPDKGGHKQSAIKGKIGDKSAIKGEIGDKSVIKCDSCNKESSSVEQKLCLIIEYMQTHKIVTVADIAQLLSIKSSRSRDYLRILVDRGVLATNGANKNRTYTLKSK